MATHSSFLAWRIPGTGSLVGCRLWGRTESDTAEATWQQQQQHISLLLRAEVSINNLSFFCKVFIPVICLYKYFNIYN